MTSPPTWVSISFQEKKQKSQQMVNNWLLKTASRWITNSLGKSLPIWELKKSTSCNPPTSDRKYREKPWPNYITRRGLLALAIRTSLLLASMSWPSLGLLFLFQNYTPNFPLSFSCHFPTSGWSHLLFARVRWPGQSSKLCLRCHTWLCLPGPPCHCC